MNKPEIVAITNALDVNIKVNTTKTVKHSWTNVIPVLVLVEQWVVPKWLAMVANTMENGTMKAINSRINAIPVLV
jgi:hypothetical protein